MIYSKKLSPWQNSWLKSSPLQGKEVDLAFQNHTFNLRSHLFVPFDTPSLGLRLLICLTLLKVLTYTHTGRTLVLAIEANTCRVVARLHADAFWLPCSQSTWLLGGCVLFRGRASSGMLEVGTQNGFPCASCSWDTRSSWVKDNKLINSR